MASTVTDGVWRRSSPEAVEQDLAAVWREVGERRQVARSVMSNLVVFHLKERRSADRPDPSDLRDLPPALSEGLLREVVARHPSRVIIVEQDRGRHEPGRPIDARVGVSVFGPPKARYAVEWVVLQSACGEASWPSVLRRFAHGDVPTSIWWTDDLSSAPSLDAITSIGRQLLYDSRRWRDVGAGIRLLAPLAERKRVDLADLNWRRLAPLRMGLAQACRAPVREEDQQKPSGSTARELRVRIAHRRGEHALASLLCGWLAARLHCSAESWPTLQEEDLGAETLQLDLTYGDRHVTGRLNDERAELVQPGMVPLTIAGPSDSAAERVAAELRSLSTDRALRDAILALASRPAI